MMFYWGEPEIERLRVLWAKGVSCADIGRQMGTTKNAVVGKARRLGLMQRRPSRVVKVFPARLPAVAGEVGFAITELVNGQCRYPVAETRSGHRFCGAGCEDGVSYCPEHKTICFSGFKFQRQRPPAEHNILRRDAA
jgi:GcrA cell cycle regulator